MAYNPNRYDKTRIEKLFEFTLKCRLSYKQEELVLSFQDQFKAGRALSEKQLTILEDIYEKAGATNG